MQIRFKKLSDKAKKPIQGSADAAGWDFFATSRFTDEYGNLVFGTDIAVEIPKGYVGLLFPRSSICKQNLYLTNCVGVIDADYRGEITAKFKGALPINRMNPNPIDCYKVGERICQIVIVPFVNVRWDEVDELSNTKRGTGGYGSTGK